ncbi:MAG: DUF4249 domain-containing protein [Cyclobacteriaceae bacterium]
MIWALILGCEEPIDLVLPEGQPRVVISGWVTTDKRAYTVSVTRTVGFNDHTTDPGVTGAEVYVLDRSSRRYDFSESAKRGIYLSDPDQFTGVPGEAYQLYVNLPDGAEYVSNREILHSVPNLDTVFFDTSFDPTLPITDPDAKVYFVKGSIADIPNVKNFYRWKMYINDTLKDKPEELVIFDDKFTDGNTFEAKVTDILLKNGDQLKLEQWSLTEGAFDFYSLLVSQISSDQIGPSTPPSAVTGNMRNINDPDDIVLGYFGASEVVVKTAEVEQ